MFTYRGRGGPSQSTPANVTCQKCLKKGHYSYECKSTSQDRPYVSRPSRSQQLRNPKLVPELTNDKPDPLETKAGAADAELAKKEAERAKKRELEKRDDELVDSVAKRRRSVSSESVSSISTRSSRSPPPKRRDSPAAAPRRVREDDAPRGRTRSRSDVSRSRSRSMSPPQRSTRAQRDSRSPRPRDTGDSYRERGPAGEDTRRVRGSRAYDSSVSRSRSPPPRPSRSPVRDSRSRGGRDHHPRADHKNARRGRDDRGPPPTRQPPRERSLSPFSKRLAMSRAGNGGGR